MNSNNPIVSIIQNRKINYPSSGYAFSPSVKFPEYPFQADISAYPNQVYEAVRNCFVQAKLDLEKVGLPEWNPLGSMVAPGSKVFVLCNFVHHRRNQETVEEGFAKITHASVLRAVIDYLLIATGPSGLIRFGNAPVQSANWEQLLEETGSNEIIEFYRRHDQPVYAHDLRALKIDRDSIGMIKKVEEQDAEKISVEIDLGADSLLEDIFEDQDVQFRVGEYDANRTQKFHKKGHHIYLVHQHILKSDVIFSIPKLKTHQKVGITCGLKGTVGVITHKDCLAHHRFGSPNIAGDEYPNDHFGFRTLISHFHDHVWQSCPKSIYGKILRIIDRNIRRLQSYLKIPIGGGWQGNDTAWRMALDIARIVAHADHSGKLKENFIRPHFVLIDGIIGGQGNGPLAPIPIRSGALIFSNDIALADFSASKLMGFNLNSIKLIDSAFKLSSFAITDKEPRNIYAVYNQTKILLSELQSTCQFIPPPNWDILISEN